MEIAFDDARAALVDTYGGVASVVAALGTGDLARPSRCAGWTVADLLFHLLLDAQRALVALATPAADEPDADAVTYWAPFLPTSAWSDGHRLFVQRSTAAFPDPAVLGDIWRRTADAVVHAAGGTPPDGRIETQDHVLTVPDFLATLVVEATVHHLDLVTDLPSAAGPSTRGLAVTRSTLDGLLGEPVPTDWDDVTYALKATGRLPLDATDGAALGPLAGRFPLLG